MDFNMTAIGNFLMRRRHGGGGGASISFGRWSKKKLAVAAARRGVGALGGKKNFFRRLPRKCRTILNTF